MNINKNTDSIDKKINDLLLRRDYEELSCLDQTDRHVWRFLQSNLYQTNETLRWHTIEAIPLLIRRRWDSGWKERVLDYLRRLIWSISDESGGIGWSAPQTIAEIVAEIPQIYEPFINIMIDRTFTEPILIKSGLWGIGRLGQSVRQSVEIFQDIILASFKVDDPETLGLAAWALGEVRFKPALFYLKNLKGRPEPVRIYVTPRFLGKTLGDWGSEAIDKINL